MEIAVVTPVLNEQETVTELMQHVAEVGCHEFILVDGQSADATVERARSMSQTQETLATRIIDAPRGRASQMNAGAAQAHSDVLLFLHADTRLPANAKQLIQQALADPDCVGGRFDVRFPRDEGYAWVVSRMMNWRSRWSGIFTGDQTMFIRRSVFENMGGFADIPLMEDIEFAKRLKTRGRVVALRDKVTTSFRRWEQHGPLNTIVRMWVLRFLYWAGWNPQTLNDYYDAAR